MRLNTYIATLVVFALALAASWIYWYGISTELRLILASIALAILILLDEVFSLRVDEHTTIGTVDIGIIVAIAACGPTWAAIAMLPAALFTGRTDKLRAIYEVSRCIVAIYLAGMVFFFASDPLLANEGGSLTDILYATLVSGVVLLAINEITYSVLLKVKYEQPFRETWRESTQPYLLSELLNVLTAAVGVMALVVYGPVAAVVAVAGAMGSRLLVYRSRTQVKEIEALRGRVGSLEEALAVSNMSFGAMMIEELGRRDGFTHRHAAATATYAHDLARELKLDSVKAGRLRMAGLLHNIGLFGMPEDLLLSNGKPNSVAQNLLSEHPVRGEAALSTIPEFKDISSWVRWHHERPDGRGYPDKLRGTWIPLEAKILAVAQDYADMVLDKPRRSGVGFAQAREHLSAGADTEFDGLVVRAFLRILDTETEGYRLADDDRFVFPSTRNGKFPEAISENSDAKP